MNYHQIVIASGLLIAATENAVCQPAISALTLNGQRQTAHDSFHPYARMSASLGADVTLTVTASGTGSLGYQWRFNQNDLVSQTNQALRMPSLSLTNSGDYTVVVTDVSGVVTSQVATVSVDPTFTKITKDPIVNNGASSWGSDTWGDYNNDGFPDLFAVNGQDGAYSDPFLFRNLGNGTFTNISYGAPVNVSAEATSACWGDYDNDGNLDLFVDTVSSFPLLYHNNGDTTFTRGQNVVSGGSSFGCTWADYDNDGLLDLFLTTFDSLTNSHCFLYRNNGDGTFTSITNGVLVTELASSIGCAWGDYDNDGKMDLFVGGGRGYSDPPAPNRLYHNNGDGTFTKVSTGNIVTDLGFGGSCAWGDYDNDGYLDLFVQNGYGVQNMLYHNNGNGTFTRITNNIVGTDAPYNSRGCAWGDYDNDGFLDLFVTQAEINGVGQDPQVVNLLYHNNGDGTFTKIVEGSPVNEYSDSEGCSWVDYDNDGFLDLFAARENGRGNFLYHNNGNSNAWLTVKLVGLASNRSGIGAKVRVQGFYRGASRWQLRQVTGGAGWANQEELRAHFGLGDATNVDLVRIEWPSGIVQTLTNVSPRQFLTVVEHQAPGPPARPAFTNPVFDINGGLSLSVNGSPGFLYVFESSTNLLNWKWLGARTNASGSFEFTDAAVSKYPQRFYRVSAP